MGLTYEKYAGQLRKLERKMEMMEEYQGQDINLMKMNKFDYLKETIILLVSLTIKGEVINNHILRQMQDKTQMMNSFKMGQKITFYHDIIQYLIKYLLFIEKSTNYRSYVFKSNTQTYFVYNTFIFFQMYYYLRIQFCVFQFITSKEDLYYYSQVFSINLIKSYQKIHQKIIIMPQIYHKTTYSKYACPQILKSYNLFLISEIKNRLYVLFTIFMLAILEFIMVLIKQNSKYFNYCFIFME
ncbi:unnamed protein product [Paramecium sonneborni]|uniref:Transmembrane protein n=1 Tax=Paramecium sonneborni TaxID=65129 RepID=A0A8S1RGP8_9CILI|nr:unnamed protein product [Paramecium sonneborni]